MAEISREYASALFELAKETNSEKEFFDSLKLISETLMENPEYIDVLASPCIPQKERTDSIAEAFGDFVPKYVLSFMQLLCKNGRIREFEECFSEYEKMYLYFSRETTAYVTSAIPLTDEEKERIHKKLENLSGRLVTAEYSVDKSLLGGAVVKIDGKIYDGSLKHQLNELKEVMGK